MLLFTLGASLLFSYVNTSVLELPGLVNQSRQTRSSNLPTPSLRSQINQSLAFPGVPSTNAVETQCDEDEYGSLDFLSCIDAIRQLSDYDVPVVFRDRDDPDVGQVPLPFMTVSSE